MFAPQPPRITLASAVHQDAVAELVRVTGMEVDVGAELERKYARLWLAWIPERRGPVGFLLGWDVADELHVIDVATHPELRRRGVARALLDCAVNHARARQARLVLLEVRAGNGPAIALYTSHGFEETTVRRHYYSDGENALEMALDLAAAPPC